VQFTLQEFFFFTSSLEVLFQSPFLHFTFCINITLKLPSLFQWSVIYILSCPKDISVTRDRLADEIQIFFNYR